MGGIRRMPNLNPASSTNMSYLYQPTISSSSLNRSTSLSCKNGLNPNLPTHQQINPTPSKTNKKTHIPSLVHSL